ncbi:RNA polymerase sigma factor [Dysgonomonas sp. ZJ709]|uniref:RNA polymerase sigma factor n=1 Tax=Dysgonomonas sp. ZJ709 TaxID=2709797 RepID=UPI0013ED6376|nr:sigma-70 family RNA polymerase sigma factor [Dysgonomonas sp. ZJ709]
MVDFDIEIVERCKTGERRAQMQLYTAFYKRVYNSCLRILRSVPESEDAMQESFLKAFSGLDSYDRSTPFEAWILRIAINTSIDKLRKKDLELTDLNENIHSDIIDADDDDWDEILAKVEQVKAAIERLPDSSRLIINLYLIEGYDHEEIAEILNIAPGTSRIQYMRAKQRLIKLM